MTEIIEVLKQFGIAGVVAIMAWILVRYLIKSSEQKNNVIGNHIQSNTKALLELNEINKELSEMIKDSREIMLKIYAYLAKL
jgi:ammonia channel protein AmtB